MLLEPILQLFNWFITESHYSSDLDVWECKLTVRSLYKWQQGERVVWGSSTPRMCRCCGTKASP